MVLKKKEQKNTPRAQTTVYTVVWALFARVPSSWLKLMVVVVVVDYLQIIISKVKIGKKRTYLRLETQTRLEPLPLSLLLLRSFWWC